jgi:transcriptional regulator
MSQDEALAFAAQSGVGHLTTSINGRVESVLIPFFIDDEHDSPTIYGHVSASNAQVVCIEDCAEALLIVDGPIAYVSPGLYPTKAETGKVVPTLNYVSVQIRGRLEPMTSTEDFRKLLATLTSRFEAGRDEPWSIDDAPSDFIDTQMKAIRGFSMRIDEIQGVAKHNQNRTEPDRLSVRASFSIGTGDERQIAERMA